MIQNQEARTARAQRASVHREKEIQNESKITRHQFFIKMTIQTKKKSSKNHVAILECAATEVDLPTLLTSEGLPAATRKDRHALSSGHPLSHRMGGVLGSKRDPRCWRELAQHRIWKPLSPTKIPSIIHG